MVLLVQTVKCYFECILIIILETPNLSLRTNLNTKYR